MKYFITGGQMAAREKITPINHSKLRNMTNTPPGNIIVVCGPTASGKTRLGVQIALRYNGEIISADSRQVYRGMDIGTGKDLAEYHTSTGTVPCHLINIADPADVYTVHDYQNDFYAVFGEIRARSKLPVVVGGTGLYIEAVLRHYEIPGIPEDPPLRAELMAMDKHTLDAKLAGQAPDLYQSTDRKSKKRIVRSLEIAKHRGEGSEPAQIKTVPELRPVVLGVVWERSRLKERIRERLLARFQQGMVEEVRRLIASGVPEERIAMRGMEYRHIALFLGGRVDFDTMSAALLHDIEQLAKRQSTYFRGMERRGVAVHWINEADFGEAGEVLAGYQFER